MGENVLQWMWLRGWGRNVCVVDVAKGLGTVVLVQWTWLRDWRRGNPY